MSPSSHHSRATKNLAVLLVPLGTQPLLSLLTWQACEATVEGPSEPGKGEGGLECLLF